MLLCWTLPTALAASLTQFFREQKVEVTIYTLRNGVVRVEDAEANLYAAIDLVGYGSHCIRNTPQIHHRTHPGPESTSYYNVCTCVANMYAATDLREAELLQLHSLACERHRNSTLSPNRCSPSPQVCDKISRKLTRVKERAIAKGKWPGRAGPKEDVEEEDFQEWIKDVSCGVTTLRHCGRHGNQPSVGHEGVTDELDWLVGL